MEDELYEIENHLNSEEVNIYYSEQQDDEKYDKQNVIVIGEENQDQSQNPNQIVFTRKEKSGKNASEEKLPQKSVNCQGEILVNEEDLLSDNEIFHEEEEDYKSYVKEQFQFNSTNKDTNNKSAFKSEDRNEFDEDLQNFEIQDLENIDLSTSGILFGNYDNSDETKQNQILAPQAPQKPVQIKKQNGFLQKSYSNIERQNFHQDSGQQVLEHQLIQLPPRQQIIYLTNKIKKLSYLRAKIAKKSKITIDPSLFNTNPQQKKQNTSAYNKYEVNSNMEALTHMKSKGQRHFVTETSLQLLRKKFQLFYNYENGTYVSAEKISLKNIANYFHMSNGSVYKYYSEWLKDPSFSSRLQKLKGAPRSYDDRISQRRLNAIQRLLAQKPYLNQNQLTQELNKIEELKTYRNGQFKEMDRSVVGKLLKEANYRKRRLTMVSPERNSLNSINLRYKFCQQIKKLQEKKTKLYYLDECSFDIFMVRDKMWTKGDAVAIPRSKNQKHALLALFGSHGLNFWKTSRNHQTKYEEMGDIKELLQKVRANEHHILSANSILLLNAQIGKNAQKCAELMELFGCKMLLIPPHSQQLSPVELWFMDLRKKIKVPGHLINSDELFEIVHKTLAGYQTYDFSNYYNQVDRNIEKGLTKTKF